MSDKMGRQLSVKQSLSDHCPTNARWILILSDRSSGHCLLSGFEDRPGKKAAMSPSKNPQVLTGKLLRPVKFPDKIGQRNLQGLADLAQFNQIQSPLTTLVF